MNFSRVVTNRTPARKVTLFKIHDFLAEPKNEFIQIENKLQSNFSASNHNFWCNNVNNLSSDKNIVSTFFS